MAGILIIEEDKVWKHNLKLCLHEHRVEFSGHNGDGVRKMMDNHWDRVIVDVKDLNGLNGLRIISIIHHIKPDIPIIATTSDSSFKMRQAIMKSGVSRLFIKPFNFEELKETMEVRENKKGGKE
ncbi:response regulator [candidate division WOR-3 bacterium]|nr:response regulator [candidate division WOR-3 bacterium]